HILRIWRLSPWVKIIRKTYLLICSTLHFLVTVSRIGIPLLIRFTKRSVIGLFTVTIYSFSWLFLARRILFTISPSLVIRIRPSLSLSNLPIGKILTG